jgi:thymidylate kinase
MTRTRGYSLAVMGPDGVGKSTLCAGLGDALPDRSVRRVKVSIHASRWSIRPAPVAWVARTTRAARVLIGARRAAQRGAIVVWDRHPIEDQALADEGRMVLGRGRRWLRALAGHPDVVIVLDAPVDVLVTRDVEHDALKLERLRTRYLDLAQRTGGIVLDATRSPSEVRADAIAALAVWEDSAPA